MSNRHGPIEFLAALFVFSQINLAHSAEPDLWPSEVVTLMNQSMIHQPTAERTSISAPLIARMRTADLPEIERFFKGEAHFINLEPEPARDAFWEFRKRNDPLGRVAMQRLMIIRINAFEMVSDIVENDIAEYRQRFPTMPYDRYGISYSLSQTAQVLIDRGDRDKGLDLIVEEVRQYDKFDSAYTAYQLPGQFLAAADEQGRGEEFLGLNLWIIEGLTAAIDRRLKNEPAEIDQVESVPGDVFFSLYGDRGFDHYRWTAEMMKIRDDLKLRK